MEEGEGEGEGEEGVEEWVEPRREEGHLLMVPVRSSLGHSNGSPSGGPEIETHKQRIARAVDSVREKRQQLQQQKQQKQQSEGKKIMMRTSSSNQVRCYLFC